MKNILPTIQEKIIKAWLTGAFTEVQLAEQYNVSRVYVSEVISNHRRQSLKPIKRRTMNLARELYSSVPSELAGSFARRFEDITGTNSGLLLTPGI